MALPPTIPTSFVPHSSGAPAQRFRNDVVGAFGFFAYTVLGMVFIVALGVFFYDRFLVANKSAKDKELVTAESKIDTATVESFVRLRNRLNTSRVLLDKHIALSRFFSALETSLPASVRFSSLHISLDTSGTPKIEGTGIAKSFNALAAASTALTVDGHIKDAIFSKISVTKDSTVSFGLVATLDPKLMVFSPRVTASTEPPSP